MAKRDRQLEQIVKGFANHRRIQIMRLLSRDPHLSVQQIARSLRINYKTASEHIRRTTMAGLTTKRSHDRWVRHKLTKRGRIVLTFLRMLE